MRVQVDEYFKIGETTAKEALISFCHSVVEIYEAEYLRAPNADDVARYCAYNALRGLPGLLL